MGFKDFVGGVISQKKLCEQTEFNVFVQIIPPVSAPLAIQTLSETDSFLSADVMSPSGANQRDC